MDAYLKKIKMMSKIESNENHFVAFFVPFRQVIYDNSGKAIIKSISFAISKKNVKIMVA